MIFFTADTHFADPRVLRLDRRPFPDLAAHDEALIAAWNEVVGAKDEVYHLGDFARGSAEAKAALLARLAGTKHLIAGNNDDAATCGLSGWASVATYAEREVEGRRLVLCHYAFRTWNGMGKGAIDLHGHSHGRLTPLPRQFDIGVDAFPFRPVTMAEILAAPRRALRRRNVNPPRSADF
ncbi:hydrolase [Aureimonas endophytica]|uniref:Hydrolase n=1 Tax=Aureimonas endophytica TaxID=2027858 RepID=A0A917A265_9HYPH|nr:metallophosphoesterase family protein [Aureimonas endophytica]GGE22433.1 hydrolase [Aureimonas endophytica]